MQLNTKRTPIYNNEGVVAQHINPELQLRRSVMACMLWESSFYESGEAIADRIRKTVALVEPAKVAAVAIEARERMKLRHVPLLIVREMARLPSHKRVVAATLERVIQRADELSEFLAIYWNDNNGKRTLSAQVKKGIAKAFAKFGEFQLAKYNRDGQVKLRDALFLCHAKPSGATIKYTRLERKAQAAHELNERERVHLALVNGTLKTPDTWEVALSGGADKRATFERLIAEGNLGALALLRNLRNMTEAGVPREVIANALLTMKTERVLPFRFIAAARAVPHIEDIIEPPMLRCMEGLPKLGGTTMLLVDVSPSMTARLSGKSDLSRMDAAFGLAILLREISERGAIVAFSSIVGVVPPRRGFALADAIKAAVPSNGTLLGNAVRSVSGKYDRLIVITDEESQDALPSPDAGKLAYMVNVSSSQNGVGYGAWHHVDGWSEAIVDYIIASETIAP